MSYVLTVIRPALKPAAYGRAEVSVPQPSHALAVEFAVRPLMDAGLPYPEATGFASQIWLGSEHPGAVVTHEATGLSFRIDPADNAPHPCPCGSDEDDPCARLVLPNDHAFAFAPDAYCRGCFTWNRGDVPCLPANSGHTKEP